MSIALVEINRETAPLETLEEMRKIALAELKRHRHRLGQLTPEQECALEALLLSAVNKISHPVMEQMRCSNES